MSEDKNPSGPKREEYTFIQEKIVPRRKRRVKRIVTAVVGTIFLAVLFGLVGRLTFYLSEPLFFRVFGPGNGEGNIQLIPPDRGEQGLGSATSGSIVMDGIIDGQGGRGEGDGPTPVKPEDSSVEQSTASAVIIENTIEADLDDLTNMYYLLGELANGVNRSIVKVSSVVNGVDWFQNPYEATEETSGLILAMDETKVYILVNYGRIKEANRLRVSFWNDKAVEAQFQEADTEVGLAVVTVDISLLSKSETESLVVAPLGESYSVRAGEVVLALGNPNGYMYSMLFGIVTNPASYAHVTDQKLELISTDMTVYEEGEGILVNLKGEIVGILANSFGSDGEEAGTRCTALAISRVKTVMEQLVNQSPRAYFGVVVKDVTEAMEEKTGQQGGVYVEKVADNSPAADAGIKSGDVILSMDGIPVSSVSGYSVMIQSHKTGDTLKVQVGRMKKEMEKIELVVIIDKKK